MFLFDYFSACAIYVSDLCFLYHGLDTNINAEGTVENINRILQSVINFWNVMNV